MKRFVLIGALIGALLCAQSASAAIAFDASRAFSLYGRGMARLISGDAAGQNEMEAAIMLQRDIAEEFKAYAK